MICVAVLVTARMEKREERHGPPHPRPPPPQITDRPVIGILTLPLEEGMNFTGNSYIAGSYVYWAQLGGARVVPLRLNHPWSELEYLVRNLNGVLFTGGGADMFVPGSNPPEMTHYQKTGCAIYNLIKSLNDQGIYYPLWGTCLGFELLHQCADSNRTTLQRVDGEPSYTRRNHFTKFAPRSRLFDSKAGRYIMNFMAEENIQYLSHSFGVLPWEYKVYRNLSETYSVLATMKDHNDNTFVSIVEAWRYPIYGTQFHPEKNLFEWDISAPIPHGKNAVKMSTYLGDFFASEARRNPNQFTTEEELKPWLIYNWDPIFLDGYFTQVFAFK